MSPRTLKLLALSYLVKTAVVAAAWIAVPDLSERAKGAARAAWTRILAVSTEQR